MEAGYPVKADGRPDTERSIIEADYEAALNRIIAYHGGK